MTSKTSNKTSTCHEDALHSKESWKAVRRPVPREVVLGLTELKGSLHSLPLKGFFKE